MSFFYTKRFKITNSDFLLNLTYIKNKSINQGKASKYYDLYTLYL